MESAIVILLALAAGAIAFWKALEPAQQQRFLTLARSARAQIADGAQAARMRLDRKRSAYRALFLMPDGKLNPAGQIVFADLTKFCFGLSTTTAGQGVTEDIAKRREGRRQVWIYIMSQIGADAASAFNAVQMEEHALLG